MHLSPNKCFENIVAHSRLFRGWWVGVGWLVEGYLLLVGGWAQERYVQVRIQFNLIQLLL